MCVLAQRPWAWLTVGWQRLVSVDHVQGPSVPKSMSPNPTLHYPSLGRFGAASEEVDEFLSDERCAQECVCVLYARSFRVQ